MSLRILRDTEDQLACMYDSVTDWAFGPVFTSPTAIKRFWEYAAKKHDVNDVRSLTNEQLVTMWEQYVGQGGRRDAE